MTHAPGTHPEPAELAAFQRCRLPEDEYLRLAGHLEGCPACRKLLGELPADSFAEFLRRNRPDHTPGPGLEATPPAASGEAAGIPPYLRTYRPLRFIRRLGEGGMGAVYLALQAAMNYREVAVKIVRPALLGRPEVVRRFEQEVAAAAALNHPNIVTAYDCHTLGDLRLLVLEYVEGQDLGQLVKRKGPLPPAWACEYVRQALVGLQHAHDHGLVHRDLKPTNLMLSRQGQVKILDFGLAKLSGSRRRPDGSTRGTTSPGRTLLGTPAYIAPEQAHDPDGADGRADIYALGCTLYCLIAGGPPPAGAAPQVPPVRAVCPEVPEGVEAILARLLAHRPEDRPATAREAAEALSPYCPTNPAGGPSPHEEATAGVRPAEVPTVPEGRQDPTPGPRRRAGRPAPARLFATSAAGLLAGLALFAFWPRDRQPTPSEVRLEPLRPAPRPVIRGVVLANGGAWRIRDGTLEQTTTATAQPMGPVLLFGDPAWEDFDFACEVAAGEGKEGFKVLFRAADSRNTYGIGFGSYGNAGHDLWLLDRGGWRREAASGFRFLPGSIERDRWYRVRVSARGDRLRGFLDDEPLFDARDARHPRGRVGVSTWGTKARFRNFKVTSPDGVELWTGLPELAADSSTGTLSQTRR